LSLLVEVILLQSTTHSTSAEKAPAGAN